MNVLKILKMNEGICGLLTDDSRASLFSNFSLPTSFSHISNALFSQESAISPGKNGHAYIEYIR